jgi:hypothetical protein
MAQTSTRESTGTLGRTWEGTEEWREGGKGSEPARLLSLGQDT